MYKLKTKYKETKEQKKAISSLVKNISDKKDFQVLLGVTGSGKTFTVANTIAKLNIPTLIISHNKTLAAQLYQEFRDFFPKTNVSYFVSYYDYYQPEAYIPSTDTYIEKDSSINELIDKLRLETTSNILTQKDCIVIASVSCIYNIGSPAQYNKFVFELKKGMKLTRETIMERLIDLQYERSEYDFKRGTFRVRGGQIDIYLSYKDEGIRVVTDKEIESLNVFDPITGEEKQSKSLKNLTIFPAKHFITDKKQDKKIFNQIKKDLIDQCKLLDKQDKKLESLRLSQRVNYDLEMISELGYVKGIENYSRYFDGREKGDPPYTLLDYFTHKHKNNWLTIIDESHITFPQIRGMYAGDHSRKKTLINYGFRLPASLDNRPLKFEEFMKSVPKIIALSATPSDWELSMAKDAGKHTVVEQLTRPTGIVDPKVEIKTTKNQVSDCIEIIKKLKKKKQRALITTLTKQSAEDLSKYMSENGIDVEYLHSDVKTLERTDILDNLRKGNFDCIVGVNLLREGLDLPEVSLVAILDADKEGFLRSRVSLIQTMGRAARHIEGRVILYADTITKSIKLALDEIERRRKYQINYNKKNKIIPKSIKKPIREKLVEQAVEDDTDYIHTKMLIQNPRSLTPSEKTKHIKDLRREMKRAADNLDFELAAMLRDKIREVNLV